MYDYEREADNEPSPPGLLLAVARMVDLTQAVDGIINSSSRALENAAIEDCNRFRPMYPIGMQVSPRGWGKDSRIADDSIRAFLDSQTTNSVLYIAFGYVFETEEVDINALC